MRKLFPFLGILTLVVTLLHGASALAQTTTVYIVRHAEKMASDPSDRNPALSEAGVRRAGDLAKVLENEPIDAVFSTEYLRTKQTAGPVSETRKLTINGYPAADIKGLAEKLKGQYAGKTVLVVGHSNTVLPILQALGGECGVEELTESDYDYLFKVTIGPDGKAETVVSQFGVRTRKS